VRIKMILFFMIPAQWIMRRTKTSST